MMLLKNELCSVQYRILLSGAWNTLCCIPVMAASADTDDADSDTSEQQRQPLFDTDATPSSLYTENQQQVTDCLSRILLHITAFGFCLTGLYLIDHSMLGRIPSVSKEEPIGIAGVWCFEAVCPFFHPTFNVRVSRSPF